MDFSIIMDNGIPQMSFSPESTIMVNLFLSINVQRGSFFYDPSFGSRLHTIKKITDKTPDLVAAYVREATKWIIDCGKAALINVSAWRDPQNVNRVNLWVQATEADGNIVDFTQYVEVI